ncbi:hypothetical protein AMTRI_Chr07g78550 [Amborella trichopoda]
MVSSHASKKPTPNHNTTQKNVKTGTHPLLHCDYCHKNGHMKDQCFILMCYPKRQNKPHIYNASSSSHLGNLCFSTISSFSDPWIIDSHATKYIVYSRSFLSSINPSSTTNLLKLPMGNFAPDLHIGTVFLSEQITLHNDLCVPSFSYNSLFVKKLTSD